MSRRPLTNGEIAVARSIFRDSIDYAAVGIHDRGYAFLDPLGNMSFGGNIYLPHGYDRDFSQASLELQRLFIHEHVHVWQHQNQVLNLLMEAVREGLRHRLRYAKAYLFRLEPDKDLLEFGLEQQAAIIEEYFLRQHGGPSMGRCLNQGDDTQALLDGVLANFLADPSYARRGHRRIGSSRRPPVASAEILAA